METIKEKWDNNKHWLIPLIGCVAFACIGAACASLSEDSSITDAISENRYGSYDLPKPGLPEGCKAVIDDLWVDPDTGHQIASITAESRTDLFDTIWTLSRHLDSDKQMWACVEWMQDARG